MKINGLPIHDVERSLMAVTRVTPSAVHEKVSYLIFFVYIHMYKFSVFIISVLQEPRIYSIRTDTQPQNCCPYMYEHVFLSRYV